MQNKLFLNPSKNDQVVKGGPVDHLLFYPKHVIGVDEVGRGCLAGDVYAAAVILDDRTIPLGLADSKILSANRRESLSEKILQNHRVGIGIATVVEIEELNILQASLLAMRRAVLQVLNLDPSEKSNADRSIMESCHILVDGTFRIPDLPLVTQTPLIQGDSRALPIAAASIVAKVARDQELSRLSEIYPAYEFAKHKGYSTALHKERIREFGPCPIHRRTFAGVKEYVRGAPAERSMG